MKWPQGFRSAGTHCGIKAAGASDLGLLVADDSVEWAGTFTTNAAAAAPVQWSRSRLGSPVRAIVANSGNANACTGKAGAKAVDAGASRVAEALGCDPGEVLVASTGPIGVQLPVDLVSSGIERLPQLLSEDPEPFATSIMTTDTRLKVASAPVGAGSIVGVAKGAAMCAPNMATMLAFLATDVKPPTEMQPALTDAVLQTFNRISIDGCESTNDSVFLMSSAVHACDDLAFRSAVLDVCRELALAIASDAEGGTRLMRVQVSGAPTETDAVDLARAVADSALWRAAFHGGDPNWGRVLSALGSARRDLDLTQVTVALGSETVFDRGEPAGSLEGAAKAMTGDEVVVECIVGTGAGRAEVLSADLSADYVRLNAEGTS